MTAIDPAWPCVRARCLSDADCLRGDRCGWVGEDDEPLTPVDLVPVDERADDEFADGVPLPEPPEDEVPDEPWDPQPIRVEEIPVPLPEEYDPIPMTVEELAARREHLEAARRVHVRPDPPGAYARLGGEFDPRGRHVGCDGEPGPAGGMVGGCKVAPGLACRVPGGRFVPGFVHPSRLRAERLLFGLDDLA